MADDAAGFLRKARQSLAGAESECAAGRHDSTANRAYYACFQAAVSALIEAGTGPSPSGRCDHDVVQAQFVGEQVNRRHRYPAELRETFERLIELRQVADYRADDVGRDQAARAVRRAGAFVSAVKPTTEEPR